MAAEGSMQQHGMADAVLIQELAARMCRAPMPSQALLQAAKACSSSMPNVVYVGLVIMSRDKQNVRYATLLSIQEAAPLGSAPSASTAAGLAIHTKQAVHVRDIDAWAQGMEDLQYLRHEHGARACFAAPLVVSQSAIGALVVASAAPHAFTGHEERLHPVAALCAPYVTLMTSNLAAVEGLLKQMLPVRVALQLRERQLGAITLQQPGQAAAAAAATTAPGVRYTSDAGSGSTAAAAAAAAELIPGNHAMLSSAAAQGARAALAAAPGPQQEPQDLDGLFGGSADSSHWVQSSRWQQQRPVRAQQQQQGLASLTGVQQSDTRHVQLKQSTNSSALQLSFTFKQPQVELAYRSAVCKQWQQCLDGLFLLLSVISALGGCWKTGITGDLLIDTLALLILVVIGWALVHQACAMPIAKYLRVRVPGIAAVRLLRLVLFLLEAKYVPGHLFARPQAAMTTTAGAEKGFGAQVLSWSRVEVAGCGLLLMLGLAGQLPLAWHAAVQLVAFTGLFGMLNVWSLEKLGNHAYVPWLVLGGQLVVGWALPVAVVAVVEWRTRVDFWKKIH